MRDKQGFPGIGAIVAGAVVCGVLATPGVALATPAPDPTPMPPSVQPLAPMPPSAQSLTPMPPSAQIPVEVSIVGGAGKTGAGSSSLSALPFLGHFGGPVDRPLRGKITLANPAGRTPTFKVVDPTLLPAGITLDADGLLGGASRVPGTWTVPVEACAPLSGCATGTVTITITCRCAPAPPAPPADTSPVGTSSSHVGTPCSAGDVITS
jgi:hypothetical protein